MFGSPNGIKADDCKEYPLTTNYIASKTEICAAFQSSTTGNRVGTRLSIFCFQIVSDLISLIFKEFLNAWCITQSTGQCPWSFFYRDKGGGKERLGHFVETSWQEDLCVHFHLLFPVG